MKEFAINSKNIRIGHQVHKDSDLKQFSDNFARYTPNLAVTSVTALQSAEMADYNHISLPLQNIMNKLSVTPQAAKSKDFNAVTDKIPKNAPVDEYLLEKRAAII